MGYCWSLQTINMFHIPFLQWIMIHISIVGTVSQTVVRGVLGQAVTLPCTYSVRRSSDLTPMCWGRGSCPNSKCSNEILHTDGRRVVSPKSYRYNLKGYVTWGDVSLTIADLNEGDKGIYCCRIEVPGWFNDLKKTLNLQVDRATTTASTTTITTTSHMITTTITIAPSTTTVTHPITSPFLSTTNLASPTTSPATSTNVPTIAPSSAATSIGFLTTTPSLVNMKPSPATVQDESTKYGCSSFATRTAAPTTATASSRYMTTVFHRITTSNTTIILDFLKKNYRVLIPSAIVLFVLLSVLVGLLVKRKKLRKYELGKMKSLNEQEEPEPTEPTEPEGENGIFPL